MKVTTPFEIRVAFIGYVSVGKTTVINALFGDEASSEKEDESSSSITTSTPSSDKTLMPSDWSMCVDNPSKASDTLAQTTKDNTEFRKKDFVAEKSFDIILEEPLHSMRGDTKLVVVDIPGINEAGTGSKYKDYVNDHWYTFDVAVVVMDGRQGVNTEEQLDLLKLVDKNTASVKKIPLIVLFNKVDDPDDEEILSLLDESRKTIKDQFGTLHVIPVSAMHAFLYRCGGQMTFEEFCQMDSKFIERIGKESCGRRWRKYDKKRKLEKAFEAVSDVEQCKDGIEASNFDSFLAALANCIGDEKVQADLLEYQVDISLNRLLEDRFAGHFAPELLLASHKLCALEKRPDIVLNAFWDAYVSSKKGAFEKFKGSDGTNTGNLPAPVDQLMSFLKILPQLKKSDKEVSCTDIPVRNWNDEKGRILDEAKSYALKYVVEVMNAFDKKGVSAYDRYLVIGSMLLPSYMESFSNCLGRLKMELELRYNQAIQKIPSSAETGCSGCQRNTSRNCGFDYCSSCGVLWVNSSKQIRSSGPCPRCNNPYYILSQDGPNLRCNHCRWNFRQHPCAYGYKMKVDNGKLTFVENHDEDVKIVVPDSLEDPRHFGHVLWQCCRILEMA